MIYYVTEVENQFQKAHQDDAGYDLRALEAGTIDPGSRELISTGLQVAIPKYWVGVIKARSGLSVKHCLDVGGGVVDSGYTGDIGVCLINNGPMPFSYKQGDKIAQMLVLPTYPAVTAEKVNSLPDSDRGANGYNSTGY